MFIHFNYASSAAYFFSCALVSSQEIETAIAGRSVSAVDSKSATKMRALSTAIARGINPALLTQLPVSISPRFYIAVAPYET